jgi:hypothetical protein
MRYCSKDHQAAHYPAHKSACNAVAKASRKVEHERQLLIDAPPGDMFLPQNVFETSVGHFWGIFGTRDYMRARCGLVLALGEIKTREAVEAQLEHDLDMLRLCRSDNIGVREDIPHLMLRLDRDQECYDFIKWWFTCDPDGTYDWGNMDLPYLSVKNADVFEEVGFMCQSFPSLSHLVAATLIKVKLLLDMTELRNALRDYGQAAPPDVLSIVQDHIIRSPVTRKLPKADIADQSKLQERINKLEKQVSVLYKAVKEVRIHPSIPFPIPNRHEIQHTTDSPTHHRQTPTSGPPSKIPAAISTLDRTITAMAVLSRCKWS